MSVFVGRFCKLLKIQLDDFADLNKRCKNECVLSRIGAGAAESEPKISEKLTTSHHLLKNRYHLAAWDMPGRGAPPGEGHPLRREVSARIS